MEIDRCNRCHEQTNVTIMSKFNTDIICTDCKRRERDHPAYIAADRAEVNAVRQGIRNFPGIGLPADLLANKPSEDTNDS